MKVKTPNKFEQCGVYKLNCNSCHKAYIGQTGRNFKTRFKEHIQDIKTIEQRPVIHSIY
jgi:hypothetical protein